MSEGNSFTVPDSAKCENETTFQLRRKGVSNQSVSVSVDFSPIIRPLSSNNQQETTLLKSIPVFNMDGQYFTPAFILEMDKEKYVENKAIYEELFVNKMGEADEEISQMHVNLPLHRTFMEKSEFHVDIHTLCNKFTQLTNEQGKKRAKALPKKTKTVKKEPKQRRGKRQLIESTSTRVHSTELLCEEVK